MQVESVVTHHAGQDVVRLTLGWEPGHEGWIAIVDAAGVCLADSSRSRVAAERWLERIFEQLYPGHACGLGCVREPGCHFLATRERLVELTGPGV